MGSFGRESIASILFVCWKTRLGYLLKTVLRLLFLRCSLRMAIQWKSGDMRHPSLISVLLSMYRLMNVLLMIFWYIEVDQLCAVNVHSIINKSF